ncbi:TIGR03086 family metal-binding protein [Microlunatus spumicola]|uniref:TIGR03086 family metal-binding protein n=1 Tax=Microlunatus spumicola TaxID=81499 RepID=A0ABP6WBW5_9ACTN
MSISLRAAVAPTCAAVAAVLPDLADLPAGTVDLSAPTPCTELDLRGLVEHFVGTSGAMARLGRDEPLDADDPWGGGQGSADSDWAGRLRDNLGAVAHGWDRPEAWTGEARVGGAALPRPMLGEMALVEVAVHGWDVARALGRTLELDPEVAEAVDEAVSRTAELGRQMGAYGPEVAVPHDADGLARALGKAGRDPRWSA